MKEPHRRQPANFTSASHAGGHAIPVQGVLELVREAPPLLRSWKIITLIWIPKDIRACVQYAIDVVAAEDHPFAPTHEFSHRPRRVRRHLTLS